MEVTGVKVMSLCYAVIAICFLSGYLIKDMTLFTGLLMLPYVARAEKGSFSLRFLIPAILFALLAFSIPARTTFFFALFFALLLFFENKIGKLNRPFFFVIMLLSPLFKYSSDTLSFPLRLWLSRLAAETITFAGIKAHAAGNIIHIDGFDFYIDQACAGLNMLNISLLISLFIITFHQKKTHRSLSFLAVTTLLVLTFSMNIFANFFRILLVVIFKIMPGTTMHDLVGLLSLSVYVILPLIWLTGPFVTRFGSIHKNQNTPQPQSNPEINAGETATLSQRSLRYPMLHLAFFVLIICLYHREQNLENNQKKPGQDPKNIALRGYHKTILENDVLKFENNEGLIYMKPTLFYAPEHNPMVCWQGSGYTFQLINKEIFKGKEVYTGTLVKGKDKLYASWWFDNGKTKTIDQLSWRWQGAQGEEDFYLVNVNAATPAALKSITEKLLTTPDFND